MSRLLLVDGSNLLFQMFFGMPARIVGRRGNAIQGTLGFVGALLRIIRMTSPTHVAVLFDGENGSDRVALDPDYKSNRTDYSQVPEEATPFSQMPDVYAALDYLGIVHSETVDCEVDDLMAGYARTPGDVHEVIIASQDSDFFQLVTDSVTLLRYRGDRTVLCTPDYVRERYGIEPSQYADHKALTGDASDHIKGADKVGPKTATQLLRAFGTLEGILASIDRIERPSVRASIAESRDRLRLNYKLIKLDRAVELPFDMDAMTYCPSDATTRDVLRAIGLVE